MVGDWRDLSVLIVGCGSIGKRHARVLGGLGISSLRACDPVAEQRDSILAQVPAIRMYESYQDALADRPDAVLICTPPALHVPQSIQAIRAGCHVLCEKPLSNTMEGIDTLAALAASEQKKVMVALCFRYHDGLIKAKQYLDSGQIGRLVSIRAMVGEHLPDVRPDYQELDVARTGGAFELVHEIDLAIWYAALPVREVSAFSGNYSDIGIEAPDLTEILIDFEGACLASVHLDFIPAAAAEATGVDRHGWRDLGRVCELGALHCVGVQIWPSGVGAGAVGHPAGRHVPRRGPRIPASCG